MSFRFLFFYFSTLLTIISLTGCQGSSEERNLSNETTEQSSSDQSTQDNDIEDSDAFFTFTYEFGEGNEVLIGFSLRDVIVSVIVLLLFIGVPVFLIWRKIKELGINDYEGTISTELPDDIMSDSGGDKKPSSSNSDFTYAPPQKQQPEPIPESTAVTSPTDADLDFPEPQPILASVSQAGDDDYFQIAINKLKQRNLITEKLSELPLAIQPNGLLFRDRQRRQILLLPRYESSEAMTYFLQEYHSVYIVNHDGCIIQCENLK